MSAAIPVDGRETEAQISEPELPALSSNQRLRKRLSLLLCLALSLHFLPAYLAPSFALERSQVADEVYDHLNTYGKDPWGNHFRWYPGWNVQERYSSGPNGLDEGGLGDDLTLRPIESFNPLWFGFLFCLWCLPSGLCLAMWLLVLRAARRARDRSLGWRELGWAALTGGPLAAFAAGYTWWGSNNWTWKKLLTGQSGLLGWRLSMTGSVVVALFVAGYLLSRPSRRSEEGREPAASGGEPI